MKTDSNLLEDIRDCDDYGDLRAWRDQLFRFAAEQGYANAMVAIFASHEVPIELHNAYLQANLPDDYLRTYDAQKFGEIDPIVLHCMAKSTPLVWSSQTFVGDRQLQLYAAMRSLGMCSGVALPYHGPSGEFGMLCFAGEHKTELPIAELTYFRDAAMEAFAAFMRKGESVSRQNIEITARELECLEWCAVGKSSWDIAHLMNCTEATVNYHFANIRRKFGASSRRMAVIKAIQLGFLSV